MEIRGVHYGLSLVYSYLLPLFEVTEVSGGFIFEKIHGAGRGVECRFREGGLITECRVPRGVSKKVVERLLGLEKLTLARELCRRLGLSVEMCTVSLLYEPSDARLVFYAVYLSRNTDYYVNTVRWARQVVEKGFVDSTSYVPLEFNRVKPLIDRVFSRGVNLRDIVTELLGIPGIGVKSVVALLLHGYGLTEYAPVDRHYARYLGFEPMQPPKNHCSKLKLACRLCSRRCIYGYTVRKYGVFNGFIQSLVYVHARLLGRRSLLEKILVRDPSACLDVVEKVLTNAREFSIFK